MEFLHVQTFLLLLAVYLLGAMFGCLVRRAFYNLPEAQSDIGMHQRPAPAAATPDASLSLRQSAPGAIQPKIETVARPAPLPSLSEAAPQRLSDPMPAAANPAPAPQVPRMAPMTDTPAASNAPVPPPRFVASAPAGPADDLTRIRGIDAALRQRLQGLGVIRFDQIAAWTAADVQGVNQSLALSGSVQKDNWIEQAQILAKGGETHYSRRRMRGERADASPGRDEGEAGKPATPPPTPAPALAVASARPPLASPDDQLQRIASIDAGTARALNELGVMSFWQMASLTAADIERIETVLGQSGRVAAENWIEQAEILSRGGASEPARRHAAAEAPRPARLADAIREQGGRPGSPVRSGARPDISGLRSVRSEVFRSSASASRAGELDDLKRIRGVGVLIEKKLNSLAVTSYEQIANWTSGDIDRFSQLLDFRGRIERENWVEQARILASGGQTEFSRRLDRSGEGT